ncbi:MAG: hypothetical protein WBD40_23355 [Tepidisphaeraceae bacterium]
MAEETSDDLPTPHVTLPYQPAHHAPRNRVRAVVTGFTGIVSLCIGGGLGVLAVGSALTRNFGIAAAVSAFFSVCFLLCAVVLFRQANELWGWVK